MSYIPIASQTLTANATSVTFSNIPTTVDGKTLRDLVLVVMAKYNTTAVFDGGLRLNGDTGNNYSSVQMLGTGSAAQSFAATGSAYPFIHSPSDRNANPALFMIFDYAQTDKHKSILSRENPEFESVRARAGRWANTSAITSITFITNLTFNPSYIAGSTFSLYGIEA